MAQNWELDEFKLDVLREIGNIGAGNAATSLSALTDLRIDKTTPTVRLPDINAAVEMLGGPERVAVAILDRISGDLEGIMMFIIGKDFIRRILDKLTGPSDSEYFNELEISAIAEIGNIMVGAYAGAVSLLSGMRCTLSVPAVTVDMVGAIMNVPATEMEMIADRILIIEDEFYHAEEAQITYTLFIPAQDSLKKLLSGLGVDA